MMLTFLVAFFSGSVWADFGELDLVVRESVEREFQERKIEVEMNRFEYDGKIKWMGNQAEVFSVVWAEQKELYPYWGWYRCRTMVETVRPGVFRDLGSNCHFDVE